jgi:hypothetical protein
MQILNGNLTVNSTSFRLRSKKTKKVSDFRHHFGGEAVSFGGVSLEAEALRRRLRWLLPL